jgi:hypothetical protein
MQIGKTSSTELRTGKMPVANAVQEVVPFDPLNEIVFSMQDPNAVTRDNIAAVARQIFGGGEETADLIAQLVEDMIAVAESRSKVVSELVVLGGRLQRMMKQIITHHTGKVGDNWKARRKAASLAFSFFEETMQITRPSAYGYIRCHQKFADNAEAIKMFSYGELNLLAAQDVTDEQVNEVLQQKTETPEMSRADIKKLLKTLQAKEEALADRDHHLQNVEGLLADSKLALDVSHRENTRLMEAIATQERGIAEHERSIASLSELLAKKTAGYPALEKELADKKKELSTLTAEFSALQSAPPKVQHVEVPVEKVPEAYKNLEEAITGAMAQLTQLTSQKEGLQAEMDEMKASVAAKEAELKAGIAVKDALDDLLSSWGEVAGKMATVQLAVQASANPEQFNPTLEALAATMRKYVAEIEAAVNRKPD